MAAWLSILPPFHKNARGPHALAQKPPQILKGLDHKHLSSIHRIGEKCPTGGTPTDYENWGPELTVGLE